ncbi:hypothetical protein ACS0TY_006571 [Phlomoides rotata]
MQLQVLIEKSGLLCVDAYAGTSLLGMYGRHGCVDEALEIFECMPKKNLVSWNIMISVLGQMGYIEDCIFMFTELRMSPVGISESTFVSVLSCLKEVDIKYVKSASTCLAEKMFENAHVKDIVSWNTIIGGMENSDRPTKALHLFIKMCVIGLSPNETTLANVLHSCSRTQILSHGKCIHAKMIKKGFHSDVYTGRALVNFYAKCDKVQEAHICFDGITQKNLVSWNSLMVGYSNRGSSFTVVLLQEMIQSGYNPNEL